MRSLLLALTLLLVTTFTANAKIRCKGPYQIVQGNQILTPWCEDNYLAQIARRYGVRVSNRQIRQNPNRKEQVCRHIGHDIRIQHICSIYRGGSRSGPF